MMKKLFTLFTGLLLAAAGTAQTTVYTTGQSYADAWTGWSVPVTTGITSSGVNGANIYSFSGMASTAFTVETRRQFTINSNDLDLYLNATTQNATVSIEFSTDNVSYTSIGSQAWGPGLALSALIVATFDPGVSTFWLKLKMTGTFGSPSQTNFNSFKIDAELTAGNSVSINPTTTQNIPIATNGSVLTASEAPSAATSREWKYTLTSGAGYVSFGVPQTGLTYTPNFAAAGTYYVVCVSNFAGDVKTSNEVQINVAGNASVEEFTLGSSVFYTGEMLEIKSILQEYEVQIFDITGQLIASEHNMKSYNFSAHNTGIYFVTFLYEGQRKTVKIANIR